MEALRTADEIRDANTRYHDVAAESYDSKWGIDFGEVGQAQVVGKLRKVLGSALDRGFERSLEVGAGTGYFSLNLLRAGIVREASCTDISPGMVGALRANAERLGLGVTAARADAEALPFAQGSFDLVLGHAVLHHLLASSTACSGPAAASCSPASRRASATGWPPSPSEGHWRSRRSGVARCALRRRRLPAPLR
jgi:SAM-dependent methyltransferase